MKELTWKTLLDKLCWGLGVLFLFLVCVLTNESYGAIVLLGCAGLVFLLSAVRNNWVVRIHIGPYHWMWALFGFYCLASSLWAWVPSESVSRGVTLLAMTFCVALMYVHFQQERDMWRLYSILKWVGFFISLYTIASYGANAVLKVLSSGVRLEVEFTNINFISIQAALAVLICLYEVMYQRKRLATLLMCIPCLFVIAASGTRKSLLVVLLGIVLLLYLRYQGRKDTKNVIGLLVWSLGAAAAMVLVLSLPAFSGLLNRMSSLFNLFTGSGKVDTSALARNTYIQIGFQQFLKNPIFGIGINNSGVLLEQHLESNTYLHNNMVELLCCGGIVGFLLYYAMHAYCFYYLFRATRRGDVAAKLGLTLLVIFTVMDVARVSYYIKPTFFYFMIFFLQARQIKQRGFRG